MLSDTSRYLEVPHYMSEKEDYKSIFLAFTSFLTCKKSTFKVIA